MMMTVERDDVDRNVTASDKNTDAHHRRTPAGKGEEEK